MEPTHDIIDCPGCGGNLSRHVHDNGPYLCDTCEGTLEDFGVFTPGADEVKPGMSIDAKNAMTWLACSPEADNLTCREARGRILEIFGPEVSDELRRFFTAEPETVPSVPPPVRTPTGSELEVARERVHSLFT